MANDVRHPPVHPSQLTVALGARSYDIVIGGGVLAGAGKLIAPHLKRKRVFIITDANVAPLHGVTLARSLADAGITSQTLVLAPGESTKTFAETERIVLALLEKGLERSDLLIALGGGVVGDLTGFAAAIALRGVGFIQVPTTLLAQVDSSVGGKTGIDTKFGKNTIGAFHQPRLVLIDTDVLATLPKRELKAGYAEIVKYGLIKDKPFFEWLETNGKQLIEGDANLRAKAIERSCAIKAEIVGADEREEGERALLNLGHTFGHALESATGFSNVLLHGEAVSIGMMMAAGLSERLGLLAGADVERVASHLRATGLPTRLADCVEEKLDPLAVVAHMRHDKKVKSGRITFILLNSIGSAFIGREVDDATLLGFLTDQLK